VAARFLRLFFHLLYHQFAFTYDWVSAAVSVGAWNDWVKAVIPELTASDLNRGLSLSKPELTGGRLLEMGHGPGHLLLELAHQGYRVTGLDRSPQMGRRARRLLTRSGFPDIPLIRGSSTALPCPTGYFDALVATFPAEYIADPQTWREARRVLKPGGRFVVLGGVRVGGNSPVRRFTRWLYEITGQAAARGEEDMNDEILARLEQVIADIGFELKVENRLVKNSLLFIIIAQTACSDDFSRSAR